MIRYKWPMHTRQGQSMLPAKAVAFALSDADPEARNRDLCDIVGRLITILSNKGVLLPHELVTVLGDSQYELVQGNGTKET